MDEKLFITLDHNMFHLIPQTESQALIYIMAILAVILFIILKGDHEEIVELDEVGYFYPALSVFLVLCCIVIWHFKGYTGSVLWFMEGLGFIRSTIAEALFLLFTASVVGATFLMLVRASSIGGFGMYFLTAIIGSVLIIPVYIVTSFTSDFPIRIINKLFFWTNLIQLAVLTGYCIYKKGDIKYLIICYIIYPLGILASYILLAEYIWLWVKGKVIAFDILNVMENGIW